MTATILSLSFRGFYLLLLWSTHYDNHKYFDWEVSLNS